MCGGACKNATVMNFSSLVTLASSFCNDGSCNNLTTIIFGNNLVSIGAGFCNNNSCGLL